MRLIMPNDLCNPYTSQYELNINDVVIHKIEYGNTLGISVEGKA